MSRIATFIVLLITIGFLSACQQAKMPATKVGKPYVINGKTYYPSYDASYDKIGEASWYGPGFHGKYTASGETYDQHDFTAAHPTLPMPSLVRVTNLQNGKSLVVRINDRGPFASNRIIDLSKDSANALGITGTARVRVQFLEKETKDYMEMVKNNEGRIIPMAEYHHRAKGVQNTQQLAALKPTAAAPVTSVSRAPEPQERRPVLIRDVLADDPAAAEETAMIEEASQDSLPAVMPVFESEPEAVAQEASKVAYKPAPEPKPEPVVPQPSQKAGSGDYVIQLGSFTVKDNAHRLADKLSYLASPFVEQVEVKGRPWWRVRIGNFGTRDEAEVILSEVRAAGVADARIVRQ